MYGMAATTEAITRATPGFPLTLRPCLRLTWWSPDAFAEQHLVEISLLAAGARHEIFNPRREGHRFPYWPT
jgi:hypothetical protein